MANDVRTVESADPATAAFSRLEGEIALMRRAIENLATEKANIDIPDYNPTLGEMAQHLDTATKTLAAIAAKPAMEMTPETMAQRMAQAARKASAFRCFLRPAPLCFAGDPFPALRRGHFSLPLRRTSAVRQLLRPRLRQKARFPQRGTLPQALRSPARAHECAFVFRSSPM